MFEICSFAACTPPALPQPLHPARPIPTPSCPALPCRYNKLLVDRTELEERYEGRLRTAEETSSAQVVALDAQFQQVKGGWAGWRVVRVVGRQADRRSGQVSMGTGARGGGTRGLKVWVEAAVVCRKCSAGLQLLDHQARLPPDAADCPALYAAPCLLDSHKSPGHALPLTLLLCPCLAVRVLPCCRS